MRHLPKKLWQTAPLVYPENDLGGTAARIKYIARALVFAPQARAWLELIQHPTLRFIAETYPFIYSKLQRPYLHRALHTAARLKVLEQHYTFVSRELSSALTRQIYSQEGLRLATIDLGATGIYWLRLGFGHNTKEGDLMLSLHDERFKGAMFCLTFAVSAYGPAGKEFFIGGLQGNKKLNEREKVVELTREMYGLRPKALLVFTLQQLAEEWGVPQLRAVSDEMHVYRHYRKRREVDACYNEFWTECGGTRQPDGNFELPAKHIERDMATIKPNKRSLYRRRYAMLAAIADKIRQALRERSPLLAPAISFMMTGWLRLKLHTVCGR